MIFIGYSNVDRYSIVESIVFHLKNYGFTVWYDFYDMFLGDSRYLENFQNGISNSKYVIIIISEGFFLSNCAKEELNYAHCLYEKGDIVLLPIFYEFSPDDLPKEYSWIRKIIYNEVSDKSGTLYVTNQIIERMLHDASKLCKYRTFSEIASFAKINNHVFLNSILEAYLMLDIQNYTARIAMLYSIYLYIKSQYNSAQNNTIEKIVSRIIKYTTLNIDADHLSFSIFSLAILLSLNEFIEYQE